MFGPNKQFLATGRCGAARRFHSRGTGSQRNGGFAPDVPRKTSSGGRAAPLLRCAGRRSRSHPARRQHWSSGQLSSRHPNGRLLREQPAAVETTPPNLPGASGSPQASALSPQRGSPVVSRPRVKTLGVSANHSAFYFTNCLFCVGCSHFQLALLSPRLFLKMLVSDRLVPEISHRKRVIWDTGPGTRVRLLRAGRVENPGGFW